MAELRVERLAGSDEGIVLLGLDRPAAKNALGRQLMEEFRAALEGLKLERSARVVVLHSLVPGVFCAGADLKERAGMTQPEVERFVKGLRAAFTDLEDLPLPTIAAIEGAALGGGLELALACDLRVAGVEARLGLPETGLAIIPGAGGTQRLPRLIGRSKAKELIFTGRRLNGEEAAEAGVVDHAVPAGQALDRAMDLAREILPNGPIALKAAKAAINGGMDLDRDSGLALERACYAQVIPTKDRLEGLAAFREKRKPAYRGE
ncbi:MAG: enoyl-CoA hydratase/isomerase family protein [Acidobacteria bacterium]|nr:enoyl-CoA hydratase/isomerase family protein [Acidobacteriota bacterium]